MKILVCILIAYLLGALNPAALIAKLKHKNLRENGTGNLGATNTMLVFGKRFGVLVMVFDIAKAYFAVRCAGWIAPEIEWLAMAAGLASVIGHCFPFYLGFKGGKGLAAFGGVILAYHPLLFLFLLSTGVLLMVLVNYSVILPYYAAAVFSLFVCLTSNSISISLLAVASSVLIMVMHFGNILKAKRGQDNQIRPYIKNKLLKRKQK